MGNRKFVAIEEQDGKRYLAFGPYLFSTSASEWRYAVYYYLRWWTPYTLLWIVRKFWSWSVRWPLWYAEMMLDRGKPFINRLQLRADGIEQRLAWCLRRGHKDPLVLGASNVPHDPPRSGRCRCGS